MAAICKVWRQIENPTPSIEAYLLEEQSFQISPRSDLKWRRFRLFLKRSPQHAQQDEYRYGISSDAKIWLYEEQGIWHHKWSIWFCITMTVNRSLWHFSPTCLLMNDDCFHVQDSSSSSQLSSLRIQRRSAARKNTATTRPSTRAVQMTR